ncbi:MAG: beta-ketoacyl-[acyl-carrier-protein] synthase family protein [Planctomycetota bacterium]
MVGRRVAVTGLGLITPLGYGKDAFWNGLMEGRSGVAPISVFDASEMPFTHAGAMPDIDFDDHFDPKETAFWSRASKVAVLGSELAAEDAGIEKFDPVRTGAIVGSGYGCMNEFEESYTAWVTRGWKRIKPVTVPKSMANAPVSQIAIRHGVRGMTFSLATACSSGAIAAGVAAQQIRSGALDVCFSGGFDAILNESIFGAWCALRVLSKRDDPTASRPFSVDRDGLVFAEGCSIVILEEMEHAKARGARIYAELVGIGSTCDAVNIVGPDPQGEIESIEMALHDAGLDAAAIDYVNAHGTSTKMNDANETKVLHHVFGARAGEVPVSSIKGHIGHCMGAAGAIEVAATALAVHHGKIPQTLHYQPGDPDCDLDYVPDGPRDVAIEHALTESFGFGGQNSALILRRAPATGSSSR